MTFDAMPMARGGDMQRHAGADGIPLGASAAMERRLSARDEAVMLDDVLGMPAQPGQADLARRAWAAAQFYALIGSRLPGPGTAILGEKLHHLAPLRSGDRLCFSVTVVAREADRRYLELFCLCVNQEGTSVLSGQVRVHAPPNAASLLTDAPAAA